MADNKLNNSKMTHSHGMQSFSKIENSPKKFKNTRADWFKIVFLSIAQRAVDVMMARAKREFTF